jgi:chorismate dehydratase
MPPRREEFRRIVSDNSDMPKLRMAPRENSDELLQRFEREQRALDLQREHNLEDSLAPFRVGSVPYLNTVPLTRGLDEQILFVPPSQLAEMLRRDELDAGLVSITAALFEDRYDILDGIAIASLGEVFSVFLAHKKPIQHAQTIEYDPASLASVALLQVLLAERGLHPEFKPLARPPEDAEYVLLIGNPAIDFRRAPLDHQIFDLGAAWYDLTRLPFVFAIWALQRNKNTERLRRQLREARDFGLDTLDYLIENRTEYDRAFRKDYLGWHIHYHLGSDEKRGIAKFVELLRKNSNRTVFEPKYIA